MLRVVLWLLGTVLSLLCFIRIRKQQGQVGFLHPYCNSAGGGERVLWTIIQALLERSPQIQVKIYTVERLPLIEVLRKTKRVFGIDIEGDLELVYLKGGFLIKPAPVLTLLFSFVGSSLLTLEGLLQSPCAVLVDTHGHPGGYMLAKLCGVKVLSYVHYPVISTDMVNKVRDVRPSYNNSGYIARSKAITAIKVLYYKALLLVYGSLGRCCDSVVCNSSWTDKHIKST